MFIPPIKQSLAERADNDVFNYFPSHSNDIVSIKPTVENSGTPDFDPIEKQRHFGILHYTINNRFRKIMLITIVNVIFVVGVFLLVFFTFLKINVPTEVSTTPTVQPSTSTSSAYPIDLCTPFNVTSYLFAYSMDLDGSIIDNQIKYFQQLQIPPLYTTFVVVRLDMKSGLDFVFLNDFSSLISYVQSHYPDKSSGFDNPDTGSNVLTMIDSFLDTQQVPVCGSKMLLLIKRYPNESDISQIVKKLRQYHSFPSIMISNSPSGGSNREVLYDLASRTNGLCGYYDDSEFGKAVYAVPSCFHPYMVYAVNPLVSGKGTLQLKSMEPPTQGKFWFTFTDQNYGQLSAIKILRLSCANGSDDGSRGIYNNGRNGIFNGNEVSALVQLSHIEYNMTLDFEYTDGDSRVLQIRVYGSNFVEDWQPYDD